MERPKRLLLIKKKTTLLHLIVSRVRVLLLSAFGRGHNIESTLSEIGRQSSRFVQHMFGEQVASLFVCENGRRKSCRALCCGSDKPRWVDKSIKEELVKKDTKRKNDKPEREE